MILICSLWFVFAICQPSKYANIEIPESFHKMVQDIKTDHCYKYLIFAINDETSLDLIDAGEKNDICENLLNKLQANQCRYILYDHQDPNKHLLPKNDLILIAWVPKMRTSSSETEMYYRALMVVKTLLEVQNMLIIDDVKNITVKTLENSIQKSLDCQIDQNVISTPPMDYVIDSRGLGFVYYNCMQKYKDNIAQIEGLTGKTKTYAELLQSATNLAISMRKRGVKPGDIVSVCSYEQENAPLPFLATLFLGGTACAIDTTFSKDDMITAFEQVMPKLIFVVPEVVDRLTAALMEIKADVEIVVFGSAGAHTSFFDLIASSGEETDFQPVTVKSLLETAFIIFTSGSTGVPKTVCQYHYSILYQCLNLKNAGYCWNVLLHYSTPYWTTYSALLGVSILSGGSRIIYPTSYDNNWHFANYQITTAFFSPTEILTVCKIERPKDVSLAGVNIMVGGNLINDNQIQQIRRMFYDADIYIVYGFSEIPCFLTTFIPNNLNDLELIRKNQLSIGRPHPGISFRVVNPETGEILGPNKQGELRVMTSFPIGGYYKMHSNSLWDPYGWVKSGDITYFNEDRYLFIVGRLKDVFKCQDYHIIPGKLESILQSHPAVDKAAVIGIPHEVDGHHPLGVVILKTSHAAVTPKILEEYVEEKVEDQFRLRGGVKIVDRFPTTPSGKVRKRLLEKMFVNECLNNMEK